MNWSVNPSLRLPYQEGKLQAWDFDDLRAIKEHAPGIARALEVKDEIDCLIQQVAAADQKPEDLNDRFNTIAVLNLPVEYKAPSYDADTLTKSISNRQEKVDAHLTNGHDWRADYFQAQSGSRQWSYERTDSGNQYYRLDSDVEKLEVVVNSAGTLTITTWEPRE
ncbi:MAG: hypothetical protein HY319_23585 [Armatimonadetes bacterium]|nr:hypothetical protein [Armatimonadota bacterium]